MGEVRATSRPSKSYPRLFRNRSFRWVWAADTVSRFGDRFFDLAMLWFVYAETHSTTATAGFMVVWHISQAAFSPVGGVFADRWNRRSTLILSNLLLALVTAVCGAVLGLFRSAHLEVIYATLFLLNAVYAVSGPTRYALTPVIVERDLVVTANGFMTTAGAVTDMVANAAAGAVVAVLGPVVAVFGDALSFALAAGFFGLARIPVQSKRAEKSNVGAPQPGRLKRFGAEFREGVIAIWESPLLRTAVGIAMLINVPSYTIVLLPALVHEQLGLGAAAYGAVLTAEALGGGIGGLLAGRLESRFGTGRFTALGLAVGGIGLVIMAASRTFWLTLASAAASALAIAAMGVALGSLIQLTIPGDQLGRTHGLMVPANALLIPVSTLAAGWASQRWGVEWLMAAAGGWLWIPALLVLINPLFRKASIQTSRVNP
ncbi:MAG: MFS transporter [Firmicutes bacterium]|nr:MFS transporter [Bacillota bacterium]